MPTLEAIRVGATSIFVFVVLAFITANIRTFASKRGMDTYLDRWADHPHVVAFIRYCQKALASLSPLERRWWLWLALGLSGGLMISLPASEVHEQGSVPHGVLKVNADPVRGSVLIPSRYYSAKNKEEVANRLDEISDAMNKPSEEIFLLVLQALGGYEWSRQETAPTYVQKLDEIKAKAAHMDAVLYDDLVQNERDYRQEINAILFPKDALVKFRTAVDDYRNALSVWVKLRGTVQDDPARQDLQQLVMASQRALVAARDEFLKWVARSSEQVDQTRRALRS